MELHFPIEALYIAGLFFLLFLIQTARASYWKGRAESAGEDGNFPSGYWKGKFEAAQSEFGDHKDDLVREIEFLRACVNKEAAES